MNKSINQGRIIQVVCTKRASCYFLSRTFQSNKEIAVGGSKNREGGGKGRGVILHNVRSMPHNIQGDQQYYILKFVTTVRLCGMVWCGVLVMCEQSP